MAARISIELDDRTAQGFADVMRNAANAEGATAGLGQAMAELVHADETIEGLKLRLGELEGKLGKVGQTAQKSGQASGAGFRVIMDGLGIVSPQAEQTVRDFQGLGQSLGGLGGLGAKAFGTISKAIPFVGLALGAASIAMQLFGDDSEEAGEKARQAAEETEAAWDRVQAAQLRAGDAQERLREAREADLPVQERIAINARELAAAQQEQQRADAGRLAVERDLAAARQETLALDQRVRQEEASSGADRIAQLRRLGDLGRRINETRETARHLNESAAAFARQAADAQTRALDAERERAELAQEAGRQTQERVAAAHRLRDAIDALGQSIADEQFAESAGLDELAAKRRDLERSIQAEIDALAELKDQQAPDLERAQELLDGLNDKRREHAQLLSRETQLQAEQARVEQARERDRQVAHTQELRRIESERQARRQKDQADVDALQQSLAGRQVRGGVDREQLVQQLAAQRRAAGRDTARGGRRLDDDALARKVRRDLRSGAVDPAEMQRAQAQVVSTQAQWGAQRGLVDRKTAAALQQLATGYADEAQAARDMEQRLDQIDGFLEGFREAQSRSRAKRRTARG